MSHCFKKINRFCLALSVAVAVFLAFFAHQADAGLKFAPLNPDYVEYMKGNSKTKYPPSPINWSHLKKQKGAKPGVLSRAAASLPVSFDLSAQGKTPPVADQQRWGTCWSFAAIEVMESNLIARYGQHTPLSKLHLAFFTYSFDDISKLPGFTRHPVDEYMNPIFDQGGTEEEVMAVLSRGTGPVLEEYAPYPNADPKDPGWRNYLPPAPYAPSQYRLEKSLRFFEEDDIKNALMNEGALYINFNADSLLNESNFYTPEETEYDHAVLLVGWNDNYSRENFRSGDVVPPRDGAWKIQNSWGTTNGDGGFYYISYEDKSFYESGALSLSLLPLESWDNIYFHDPLGQCSVVEGNNLPEWREANAFMAESDEEIVAVGFITVNKNMLCDVQIYTGIPEGKRPDAGKPALGKSLSVETDAAGFRTVMLDTPVRVKKGERFAVAVTLRTMDGSEVVLPVETMIPGYSDNATVSPEQSYLYMDLGAENGGLQWHDTYDLVIDDVDDSYWPRNVNVCVKAFTKAAPHSSSSGGCEVGLGALWLAALAAVMLFKKR